MKDAEQSIAFFKSEEKGMEVDLPKEFKRHSKLMEASSKAKALAMLSQAQVKLNQLDLARRRCDEAKKAIDDLKIANEESFFVSEAVDELEQALYRMGAFKECIDLWKHNTQNFHGAQSASRIVEACIEDKNVDMIEDLFEAAGDLGPGQFFFLANQQIGEGAVSKVVEWLPLVKNPQLRLSVLDQVMTELIKPEDERTPVRGFEAGAE